MKKNFLFILMFFAMAAQAVYGQTTGCNTTGCPTTQVNISTGFDQATSTYQTPLATESNWTFVAAPPSAGITFPAPCYDITPHPAWANFPNARWVSPFQSNSYNVNNPAPQPTFDFERCFCVCQPSNVRIKFNLLADDAALAYLDGIQITPTAAGFTTGSMVAFDSIIALSAGQHCLRISLRNIGSVAMGFALDGFVSGASLLSPLCCNPLGRICGTKLQDQNCDGVVNQSTDPGLAGWTIQLRDNSGNLIATTVTDNQGNYCFSNLPAGVYQVSEVNQPGWTQTFPAGSGIHTINLAAGSVATALFGNCNIPPPVKCDFNLDMKYKIENCGVNFYSAIGALPSGYQVVSTVWTFGDGYSSNELNPTHFYSATGVYLVCLKVTIFNGEECCTREICKEIKIEKPCEGDCEIRAEINYKIDPRNCEVLFGTDIIYTGLPIGTWFWDFGDGTTGTGSNPTHQYAGPGVYKVCVTLFANDRDKCCFRRFCTEVRVDCERPGTLQMTAPTGKADVQSGKKTKSDIKLTDKNVIVLNQNVPNPFAESTVITYNIPNNFNKAQINFVNASGKVIKTHDILEKGQGQVTVFANDLSTGVYLYTLVVDGVMIDSKRMIKE